MKLSNLVFTPIANCSFTREEVALLMKLSASHYDATCRQSGELGGFLYGINNHFINEEPETGDVGLEFRQIDILCKILETAHYATRDKRNDFQESAHRLYDELTICLDRVNALAGLTQVFRS